MKVMQLNKIDAFIVAEPYPEETVEMGLLNPNRSYFFC